MKIVAILKVWPEMVTQILSKVENLVTKIPKNVVNNNSDEPKMS